MTTKLDRKRYTFEAGVLMVSHRDKSPIRAPHMPKQLWKKAAEEARLNTPNKVGKTKAQYEAEHAEEVQLVKDGKYVGPPELWMKDYLPKETVYSDLPDSSESNSESE